MRRELLIPAVAALALSGCGAGSNAAASKPHPSAGRTTAATSASTTMTAPAARPAAPGPEGVPLEVGAPLAPASTTSHSRDVDGIRCAPEEQVAYHVHAHLQVYDDGLPTSLPGGIGILGPVNQQTPAGPFYAASKCYYWLHTHTSDGIIHIESPTQKVYTLGNFFDEWQQPLGPTEVASLRGRVSGTVNGHPWRGSVRAIPLRPHTEIQLAVGQPIPPYQPVNWAKTGL